MSWRVQTGHLTWPYLLLLVISVYTDGVTKELFGQCLQAHRYAVVLTPVPAGLLGTKVSPGRVQLLIAPEQPHVGWLLSWKHCCYPDVELW